MACSRSFLRPGCAKMATLPHCLVYALHQPFVKFCAPFHKKYFPAAARCARQTGFAKGRAGADKAPRRIAGKRGRNRRVSVSPCRKKKGEPALSQVRPAHACGRREPAAAGPCNMFSFKVTAYGFSGPWAPRRRLPQKASRCALQAGLHRRRRASRTPRRAPRHFRAQRRRQRPLPHRPAL